MPAANISGCFQESNIDRSSQEVNIIGCFQEAKLDSSSQEVNITGSLRKNRSSHFWSKITHAITGFVF